MYHIRPTCQCDFSGGRSRARAVGRTRRAHTYRPGLRMAGDPSRGPHPTACQDCRPVVDQPTAEQAEHVTNENVETNECGWYNEDCG